jgi:hypothetical protein
MAILASLLGLVFQAGGAIRIALLAVEVCRGPEAFI